MDILQDRGDFFGSGLDWDNDLVQEHDICLIFVNEISLRVIQDVTSYGGRQVVFSLLWFYIHKKSKSNDFVTALIIISHIRVILS